MNRIASFASHHEAELVAGFLRDEGIPVVTRSDDASGWEPGLTFVNSVHLFVSREDTDRARAVLRDLDQIQGGEPGDRSPMDDPEHID